MDGVRNIVSMTPTAARKVCVTCVDEHLRYVHFTIPRAFSTIESATEIMHAVLDRRAAREAWKRNGTNV